MQRGRPQVVFDLTIVGGRIVTVDLADPQTIEGLELEVLTD